MKKIFVIVVNYNGEKDTEECLQSIDKINNYNFNLNVIVIDNASSDFQLDVSKHRVKIHLIENRINHGFAKANNQGIEYALQNNCDYICLLNNDTTVSPDFLNELLKAAEEDKAMGIISPKIYFYPGREYHHDKYEDNERGKVLWYAGGLFDWNHVYGRHRGVDEVDHGQYDTPGETDFTTGCCMFIKKEVIEKIGALDEKYFAYLEDVDYCVRVKQAGFKIMYEPHAVIWHKNASSSGGPGSKLHFFLQERNRIYFGLKYASFKVKIHLLIKFFQYLLSRNYKISLSLLKMFV